MAFATEHQNWQIRHRTLVLFTDESRFYLSTCDRRDRLWRRRGECYAACNIIQHDWFGGGSVMVWGGISLEGCTDLYRLDNGTLAAIRYQDEILGPVVRPYAGAVGPGFLLVHNNARPHVARVCRQFLENEGIGTIDWPTGSPDLHPIEYLWDIMFRSIQHHQVALQTVQELSDALVQIWEELPQDTIRRLIRSILPATFDPLQFAYRPNRITDDAISSVLHLSLTHLVNKNSYVQMLFIDFSSAFNKVILQHLVGKLGPLGTDTPLCNWLLDFLTERPQRVRVGGNTSRIATMNTGVGLISNDDDSAYREEVPHPSEGVKALLCSFDKGGGVCGPCQVISNVPPAETWCSLQTPQCWCG
ncbi:hypothetical protein NFI96_009587, partial [Prochilodus magdalenae]